MANSASHAALPYPVKNARFTILVPYLDADGDPTDPTTPDTEFSVDAGAFADCAEEVTTISGSNGMGYITLTGAETNGSMVAVAAKVASGPKNTLITLYPRVLPVLYSGTATAGAAGTITLPTSVPRIPGSIIGCIIKTTGGTGGGGTGGANNQARVCSAFSSAGVASVTPNWETTPDNTTTFEVLQTENNQLVPPAAVQEIAKVEHNRKNVYYLRKDGVDTNDGLSPSSARLTLASVHGLAADGDIIDIGPGTFTVATAGLIVTAGVTLRGCGRGLTILSGDSNLSSDGCMIVPGIRSRFYGIRFTNAIAAASFGAAFGNNNAIDGTPATDVYAEDCDFIGTSDGIFLDDATHLNTWILRNCRIFSTWDALTCFGALSGSYIRCFHCQIVSAGPSTNVSYGGQNHGVQNSAGLVELYDCDVEATGGARSASVSAVSIANPSVLTVNSDIPDQTNVTLSGFSTTPDINGAQLATRVDATHVSIPVNVTAVADGVGTLTFADAHNRAVNGSDDTGAALNTLVRTKLFASGNSAKPFASDDLESHAFRVEDCDFSAASIGPGTNTSVTYVDNQGGTRSVAGSETAATNLSKIHAVKTCITGTVSSAVTPTTSSFRVTTNNSNNVESKSGPNLQCTVEDISTGSTERQRVASITNVSSSVILVTLASPLAFTPASGDRVKIE